MTLDIDRLEVLVDAGKIDVSDIKDLYIDLNVEIRALKAEWKKAKKEKRQDDRLVFHMNAARLETIRNKLAEKANYDPKKDARPRKATAAKAAK
jgi:hypothetical protein